MSAWKTPKRNYNLTSSSNGQNEASSNVMSRNRQLFVHRKHIEHPSPHHHVAEHEDKWPNDENDFQHVPANVTFAAPLMETTHRDPLVPINSSTQATASHYWSPSNRLRTPLWTIDNEGHQIECCPVEGQGFLTYSHPVVHAEAQPYQGYSSDPCYLSSSDLLKKLGASEYEVKELKNKIKAMEMDNEENNQALLKKEKEILNKEKRCEEEREKLNEALAKIEQMKIYMMKLPAADEAEEMKIRIKKLEDEKLKLAEENSTCQETIAFLNGKITEQVKKVRDQIEVTSKTEKKVIAIREEFVQYKKKIKDITFSSEKIDVDELVDELHKNKNDAIHFRKLLEMKQRRIEKMQSETQNSLHCYEKKLAEDQDCITALKNELSSKCQLICELQHEIKKVGLRNLDLEDGNLKLQSKYEEITGVIEKNEDEEKLKNALHIEMLLCFEEFSSLVKGFQEHAEGCDPNISVLLGTNGLSIQDASELICGTSTAEKLQEVKKLRKNVGEMRSKMSDRYVETLGENCIVQ